MKYPTIIAIITVKYVGCIILVLTMYVFLEEVINNLIEIEAFVFALNVKWFAKHVQIVSTYTVF